MLRSSTFLIGGSLTVTLGVLLGIGLFLAGAGLDFFPAWLAAGVAVGLGAFFLYVSRDERRYRREYLRTVERGGSPPPGPPPD